MAAGIRDYGVIADAAPDAKEGSPAAPRAFMQQDLWHYTVQKMVDACMSYGIKPFYGPFGDFADTAACEAQFRNAFLQGCLGAWSLQPLADRHRQKCVFARCARSRLCHEKF